jgi:uncharacterized protein (DUF2164 family)
VGSRINAQSLLPARSQATAGASQSSSPKKCWPEFRWRPRTRLAFVATALKNQMSIELTKEAKVEALTSIQRYLAENFEEPVGNIAAGALLNYMLEEIGPAIYNKAVNDVQEKLSLRIQELDLEVHEEEFQFWRRQGKPGGRPRR